MKAVDWISSNEYFFKNYLPDRKMQEVHEQALRHIDRQSRNSILDDFRPNENEEVKDYRNKNKRDITHGDVDRWLVKMSRIIRDNVFSSFAGSDRLEEYQSNAIYPVLGEGMDYFNWVMEVVLPTSIKDPNFIKVNLPFLPDNPFLPPVDGLDQTSGYVPFQEIIISFDRVYEREKVVAFQWGMKSVGAGDSRRDVPLYWVGDAENWYQMEPYLDQGGVKYRPLHWYEHDSGQLPFTNGIGVLKKGYKESLLRSYFELGDEFDSMFSDNQAIAVNHAYPKIVMVELPCMACKKGGISTGHIEVHGSDGVKKQICPTCKGSRVMSVPGPFATLSIPAESGLSENPIKPADAIHPVVYGESLFTSRVKIAWELLDKAKKSIGLDILEDVSESGIAKQYRLEDLQDIIGNVVKHLHQFIRNDLWLKECLLQPFPEQRVQPVFDIPTTFFIEDETEVLKDVQNLPISERQIKIIDYYQRKYAHDPVTAKAYEMSVIYAPAQLFSQDELSGRMGLLFSSDQIIKGIYATWAMKEIGESILTLSRDRVFQRADQLIQPFINSIPVNVFAEPEI